MKEDAKWPPSQPIPFEERPQLNEGSLIEPLVDSSYPDDDTIRGIARLPKASTEETIRAYAGSEDEALNLINDL